MHHVVAILIPALATPFYLAGIGIELAVLRWQRRRGRGPGNAVGYSAKDTNASMNMGSLFVLLNLGLGLAFLPVLDWLYDDRLFDLGDSVLTWIAVMVLWDFAFYWMHRAEHEVRLLWASHVTHHSSEHYNLSTALRQTWTPYPEHVFMLPLAWLGFPPVMVIVTFGFNLVYQFWIHTEAVDRLPGWIEAWLNTPSHHRVHHGSNPRYLDRNYGGVLIVWDRLFGTFEPETEPVVYGLTKNIHSYNLLTIAFHEHRAIWHDVRSAEGLATKAGHVLRGPGWEAAPAAGQAGS
jgi:sterol desaturase/sphingolipid hydroxylase (fatty acid hydroxylase superfamily)